MENYGIKEFADEAAELHRQGLDIVTAVSRICQMRGLGDEIKKKMKAELGRRGGLARQARRESGGYRGFGIRCFL